MINKATSTPVLLLTLSLSVLVSVALALPVANTNGSCTAEFQSKFQQLMSSCRNVNLKDCCQVANAIKMLGASTTNKIFTINDPCAADGRTFTSRAQPIPTIQARCNTEEGWLVILRRKADVSPLVNFTQTWSKYENGFGDLNTEFWYGLKSIHCLTQRDDVELTIELKNNDGIGITWTHQEFRVDGPETNYVLHIGGAERIEGYGDDQMAYHNYLPFSTIDRDNDAWSSGNCAATMTEGHGNGGGWWYRHCYHCGLTRPHTGRYKIDWYVNNSIRYFPHVEMKIRPKNCLMSGQQADSCN